MLDLTGIRMYKGRRSVKGSTFKLTSSPNCVWNGIGRSVLRQFIDKMDLKTKKI